MLGFQKGSRIMMQEKKKWVPPTVAQWLQWRLDFAGRLEGGTLRYQKYKRWSASWDHDHCAACCATFAEFNGPDIQHEVYATCDDYEHGAGYDWLCRDCFDDLKEYAGWKLATGPDQAVPEVRGRATPWVKGKLPRIECSITFLPNAEGGRGSPPQFLSGNRY